MNRNTLYKRIALIPVFVLLFLSLKTLTLAGCTGTPTACGSLPSGSCSSCGCSTTAGYCSNNGACSNNTTQTNCNYCSCAGCSWGGTSCPWVGSWNGEEWILEHEAFPFAAFEGVSTTSYDSLPNLKCINGEVKIKIYEGLPEKSFVNDFKLFKAEKVEGLVKPDLTGTPRILSQRVPPDNCASSDKQDCKLQISSYDGEFWEPEFDNSKTEDWIEVEFNNIDSQSSKLYIVARKQAFLTTYYEYMAHMMGQKQFYLFSDISKWEIFNDRIQNWWDENLKMKVEVWDGSNWVNQGLISAGYHMPGSGADDFLISIAKKDPGSNTLKLRMRFLTGAFGIDYITLDSSLDSTMKIESITPKEITLNDKTSTNVFPLSMSYDDSLIMKYDCEPQDTFFFSIDGYYLPDNFLKEREKSLFCAWGELIDFFSKGKDNVVKIASEKGLYKHAKCMDSFTKEEIAKQQEECPLYYIIWAIFFITLIAILYLLYRKLAKKHFIPVLIITLSLLGASLGVISTYATMSCSGTLNCSNCSEANCNSCPVCTWNPPVCSGTPSSCSSYSTQAACSTCGCTWQATGLLVDIVDATNNSVSSPNISMSNKSLSFSSQTSTGTLGTSSEKIFIQSDGTTNWQVSIAATDGPTGLWENSGSSKFFDFNDSTSNAEDGADSDSYGGQLSISPSSATLTAGSGCSNAGLSLGSNSSFIEGTVNSILLLSASSQSSGCNWSLTNVGISQSIPKEQAADSYGINLTLTIVAI